MKISKIRLLLHIVIFIFLTTIVVAGKVSYPFYVSCGSMSMWPEFTCKDKLNLTIVSPKDDMEVGKIYCYRPDYRNFVIPSMWYVCHRLIGMNGTSLQFKGDNNPIYDPIVERKYVGSEIRKWD